MLKEHFKHSDEDVVVFHGIDILKLNLDRVMKVSEKDFVIINASYRYVMVVEVKRTLGSGESLEKSAKQLKEAKEDLEAWFGTEGLHNWVFIPMIFTEIIDNSIDCEECKRFIVEGKLFKNLNL